MRYPNFPQHREDGRTPIELTYTLTVDKSHMLCICNSVIVSPLVHRGTLFFWLLSDSTIQIHCRVVNICARRIQLLSHGFSFIMVYRGAIILHCRTSAGPQSRPNQNKTNYLDRDICSAKSINPTFHRKVWLACIPLHLQPRRSHPAPSV